MKNQPLKFLVLTDDARHSPGNPVYYLLPELLRHPDCLLIDVASRRTEDNFPFFEENRDMDLLALEVKEDFTYDETGGQFKRASKPVNIRDYDAVLMRLPRPVPQTFMEFLVQTYPKGVFVNHPTAILKTSRKDFLMNFPDLCPPMKFCHSVEEIRNFAARFPIVLKPLEDYGGRGLVRIEGERAWEGLVEVRTEDFYQEKETYIREHGYLAMKFLKNVTNGDKRILVVGGEVLGASLRLPAPDSWLCNVAQGGASVGASLSPEEEKIIETITPVLLREGILIYGADTLEDDDGKRVLSEINTLSVGGFLNLEKQSEVSILKLTIQKIVNYVYQNLRNK